METSLHNLHSQQKMEAMGATSSSSSGTSNSNRIPFAIVNAVSPGSPSAESGLEKGDLILRFGRVVVNTNDNLIAIASTVSQNENVSF